MWGLLASLAEAWGHGLGRALAVFLIGAVFLHDILVHGHEATHGLASRSPALNAAILWGVHALVFLSGSAYRAFHLEHHRKTHRDDDPEIWFLTKVLGQPSGRAYLLIPIFSQLSVALWPFVRPSSRATPRRVVLELLGVAALHVALALLFRPTNWLLYAVAPVFTGLSFAVVVRSICEHHYTPRGDRWVQTRAMNTHRVVELLWSNVNHHLEHHLYPSVPWHRLPALRQHLCAQYPARSATIDSGYLKTALFLMRQPEHFRKGAR